MDDSQKIIEELKTEIVGLKIRLRRIEDFLSAFPKNVNSLSDINEDDSLIEEAEKIVRQYDKTSASLLQRRLSIGYARAARLMDQLEAKGILGPADGMKPREVLPKNS